MMVLIQNQTDQRSGSGVFAKMRWWSEFFMLYRLLLDKPFGLVERSWTSMPPNLRLWSHIIDNLNRLIYHKSIKRWNNRMYTSFNWECSNLSEFPSVAAIPAASKWMKYSQHWYQRRQIKLLIFVRNMSNAGRPQRNLFIYRMRHIILSQNSWQTYMSHQGVHVTAVICACLEWWYRWIGIVSFDIWSLRTP